MANLTIIDWLVRLGGVSFQDTQVKGVTPGRMWRLLQEDKIDAAFASEPFLSALPKVAAGARIVATARDILPGMPANVLVVHRNLIRKRRKDVLALLSAHREGVNMLAANPRQAAGYVSSATSWARLKRSEIANVLASPSIFFSHDPEDAASAALIAHNLLVDKNVLKRKVALAELFNTTLYSEISAQPIAALKPSSNAPVKLNEKPTEAAEPSRRRRRRR